MLWLEYGECPPTARVPKVGSARVCCLILRTGAFWEDFRSLRVRLKEHMEFRSLGSSVSQFMM